MFRPGLSPSRSSCDSLSSLRSSHSSSSLSSFSSSASSSSSSTSSNASSRPSSPVRTPRSLHQRPQHFARSPCTPTRKTTASVSLTSYASPTSIFNKVPSPNTAKRKVKTRAAAPAAEAASKSKVTRVEEVDEEAMEVAGDESTVFEPDMSTYTVGDASVLVRNEDEEDEEDEEEEGERNHTDRVEMTGVEEGEGHSKEAQTSRYAFGEDEDGSNAHNVVVCVRVRPGGGGDDARANDLWTMDKENNRIVPTENHPTLAKRTSSSAAVQSSTSSSSMLQPSSSAIDVNEPQNKAYDFRFDSLVTPSEDTAQMYTKNIEPVVDAVIKGYNGTVFAYGQTGSGKTHTMSGAGSEKGVIPRAVEQIFEGVQKTTTREFLLRVSYLEIYNETLKDLLAPLPSTASSADLATSMSSSSLRATSPTKGGTSHTAGSSTSRTVSTSAASSGTLRILESGAGRVHIAGLREEIVTNAAEVMDLLDRGQRQRHQAATDWNERSSRSHCVFILTCESRERAAAAAATAAATSQSEVRISQLNLIDLAGSERAASEKERRKEGAFINKSLLTLGTVIAKLSESGATASSEQSGIPASASSSHIPYRDSKLTRLLQTSLGGNARVAVVCTLSPRLEHANESLSTLRFGQRCKMVVTKAKRGTVMDDKALIQRYKRELDRLRAQLSSSNASSGATGVAGVAPTSSAQGEDEAAKKEHEALVSKREEVQRDVGMMEEKRAELKKQIEHLTRLILTGKKTEAEERAEMEGEDGSSSGGQPSGRRMARRSDLGTSSPSKRQKTLAAAMSLDSPMRRFSPSNGGSNSTDAASMGLPSMAKSKPFAMEAELSSLRRELASAIAARQASEAARREEVRLWQAREKELQVQLDEADAELDEAEEAYSKLRSERDEAKKTAHEEREANRLLKLVAQSKGLKDKEAIQREILASESKRRTEWEEARQSEWAKEREEAAEREKVLRSQIQKLEQQVVTAQEAAAGGQDDEKQREEVEVEGEEKHSEASNEETEKLRGEVEELKRQLGRQNAKDDEDKEAQEDFDDLVKGAGMTPSPCPTPLRAGEDKDVAALKEREAELQQKLVEVKRREEAVEAREQREAADREQHQQHQQSRNKSDGTIDLLREELEAAKLEAINLQNRAEDAEMRAAKAVSGPSFSTKLSTSKDAVELQIEVDIQKSRIASLERQLSEARAHVHSMSPSPPSSPLRRAASRLGGGTSLEARASLSGPASGLHRGGSMREYRRQDPSASSPFSPPSALPKTLSKRTSLADMSMRDAGSQAADRQEIERLNGVIKGQREMMSDLERSVAGWKNRLKVQQDIITRLVEALEGGSGASGLATLSSSSAGGRPSRLNDIGEEDQHQQQQESIRPLTEVARNVVAASTPAFFKDTPPMPDGASHSPGRFVGGRTSFNRGCESPSRAVGPMTRFDIGSGGGQLAGLRSAFEAKDEEARQDMETLSRNSSLKRGAGQNGGAAQSSPYYGAHSYNRAPATTGLGLMPGSPNKSSGKAWYGNMPGQDPEPLPLPSNSDARAARRARRRKTIDEEIQTLMGSPRVELSKRSLLDSPPKKSSATFARPLPPTPGSPLKTSSRDYYI